MLPSFFVLLLLTPIFFIILRTFPVPLIDFFAFLCYTFFDQILDMYLLPETFHYIMEIMLILIVVSDY